MKSCKVSKPACMTADATFQWVSDPVPSKNEISRWKAMQCACGSKFKVTECKCVCAIDRKAEPRLLAMIDANAVLFELDQPYTDDAVPFVGVYKCVSACELVQVTEKMNKMRVDAEAMFQSTIREIMVAAAAISDSHSGSESE